jgi:Mrp family chromosome partitioning ATPase
VRRFLDVLFQHLRWLGASLLAVPLVVGAGVLWLGDTRTVSARIHVDPAGFVADAVSDVLPISQAPADAAAALIPQLVATDWFTEGLLSRPQAAPAPRDRRAEIVDLQTHLLVTAEGPTLVSLHYATDRPERGIALLTALLGALGDAVQSIESHRAALALQVAGGELERAGDEKQRAVDEASRYAYTADRSGEALQQDPTYRRLLAAATAATQHYEEVAGLADQARVVSAAIPQVLSQAALVVDRPRVEPTARMAAAARAGLLGLTATSAIGALVIYLIALHDPRLRALDDLRSIHPGACLLSVPAAGSRPAAQPPSRWRVARYRALVDGLTRGSTVGGIVSVVSPHRGDGRSSVAAELAAALADQPGTRVHVLDLDAGRTAEDARLGLLEDVAETGVLEECRERFTWTVVDLPPLLDTPGAAGIADRCDGSVLVGRYRATRVDALARAAALLSHPPVGCVMTAHASPVPRWVSGPPGLD